ncbi:MAG TPA: RNA 2',3'-cyclic phosphodiesterase [Allosphingosinicella sp.]
MPRLFVAIRPPGPIRAFLLSIMGGIAGARWQDEDQLHLTLRFIGDIDARAAEDVHMALSGVRQAPFEIAVSGLGTFERRGEPSAFWAGVTPQDMLKALHKKVDQACQRAGLEPERRAYHPHITLARLNRSSGPVAGAIEAAGGIRTAPFTVDGFNLYESTLAPDGAHYSILERYRLG